MKRWAGVILAAGKGTRMRSRVPKVLHPVCGRPMVAHVAGLLKEAGISRPVVVVGAGGEAIRAALGRSFSYVEQRTPRGTGHAVLQARSAVEGKATAVVIANGDLPLTRPETLRALMATHEREGAAVTFLTMGGPQEELGRVARGEDGRVRGIVERAELKAEEASIREFNAGLYCFDASWLWPALGELTPSKSGEIYLTALIGLAAQSGPVVATLQVEDWTEGFGVDSRARLAQAEGIMRERIRQHWMSAGVTLSDPQSTYIDADATIGQDSVIEPGSHILGKSVVGAGCHIGPGAILRNARVGDRSSVSGSVIEESELEADVEVGPFCHLRNGAYAERGVHLGNYVEIKNSRLRSGVKSGHFSYIGDADVGRNANIGAGTITANFDGRRKHATVIGAEASIGSDSILVAPVTIGRGAKTGAGAVVTRNVAAGETVVGVPARPLSKRAVTKRTR